MSTRSASMPSQPPAFETSSAEARAVTLTDLLAKRQPGFALKPEDKKQVSELLQAFRNGQKQRVLELSADFYDMVLDEDAIGSAYFQVLDLKPAANPDFQIVMDSLGDRYGRQRPAKLQPMELEQALLLLLLAVTRTDKNSISYGRVDAQTGRLRPTTFPMTEKLLRNFLAPFGDKGALFERVLVQGKGTLMGNPAGELAWRYRQRKAEWQKAQSAWEQAVLAARKEALEMLRNPPLDERQEVYALTSEFENMINGCQDALERESVLFALSGEAFSKLYEARQELPDAFKQRLARVYGQKLSPVKASQLSARLASKLRRGLNQMGEWQESYWQEFQSLMQKLGHWEGTEWLEKWRAGKKGKIEREPEKPTAAAPAAPKKDDEVAKMLAQSQKMQDKARGRRMLEPHEMPADFFKPSYDQVTREQRKVLELLSRPDRLEELFELVSSQAAWQDPPESLRQLAKDAFARYCLTDIDTIKQVYLYIAGEGMFDMAKDLIAIVELAYQRIVGLFKKDPKMTFAQALDLLAAQQEEEEIRARLNSPEYRQSAAAQYARFRQP